MGSDHFRYLQLRDYYEREITPNMKLDNNVVITAVIGSYTSRMMIKGNTTLYVKQKWERELDVNISEDDWMHKCNSHVRAANVDHTHIFWLCPGIVQFWDLIMVNIFGYEIPRYDVWYCILVIYLQADLHSDSHLCSWLCLFIYF